MAKALTVVSFILLGLALAPAARADLGSWSPLPSMSTPRYGAAAAALSDGRVLVAGGIDGSGQATASAEIYDPSTNTWTATAPMGSARAFAVAAGLPGDQVLVAGGDIDDSPDASAEIYDGASGTWSPAPPMEDARAGAVAAVLPDGTVWVTGGSDYESGEIYDPVADTWTPAIGMDQRVGAVAGPVGSGEVLISGGFDPVDDVLVDTSELYSPSTNNETYLGAISGPQYEAAAAPIGDGDVLAAGGSASESDPSGSTSAEIYDQADESWGTVASMSTPRYGAAAAPLPDGDVLVAGGEGESGPLASAEAFTPPVAATPVNTVAPAITDPTDPSSGTISVGDDLEATAGTWSGNYLPDLTYQYQWQRCFSTCQDVGSPSVPGILVEGLYIVTSADVGATLRVVVTASDQGLSTSAGSGEVGPITGPGYHLDSAGLLHEIATTVDGGHATIMEVSVIRSDDDTSIGQVSYRVWDPTPSSYPNFTPISGTIVFLGNQALSEIEVPLTDHGVPILPSSLEIQLYNGFPYGVSAPSQMTVSLSDDSPYAVRNPLNPLDLPATPPPGDPLGGAHFFADYFASLPARTALAWAAHYPRQAAKVSVIAHEPNTERFGAWNGQYPGWGVSQYLERAEAEEPGTVPLISTYRLVDGHCGHYSDPPAEQAAYHDWITSLAEGIGTHPAVLFLEMDSLITTGCLSKPGVAVRMAELRDAIHVLSNDPHLVVYLDAGAADALPAKVAASLLLRAGVAKVAGFFLNSTHFDWTSHEIRYGEKISRLTGGKHFVINTAENGQGPLRPRHPAKEGNEVLCNPAGRGLGPLPTAKTGYSKVDAFAWIANPGVSGGQCRPDAPPSGVWWPALALELVAHENFRVR